MTRRRLLVAAVPPPAVIASTRTLRRAFGDHRMERIVPHVTLVPPFNLAGERFDEYRQHVRSVVGRTEAFDVVGERFATFDPDTPTIHLEIDDLGSNRLGKLRGALALDGVTKVDQRPFRPHLTVRSRASSERIGAVLDATSTDDALHPVASDGDGPTGLDALAAWTVESVQIMEQTHREGSGTRWEPVAEERFGTPVVIGRGGLETVLRSGCVLDRGVLEVGLVGDELLEAVDGPWSPDGEGAVAETLCVTAEEPGSVGRPMGVALGRVAGELAVLELVAVSPQHRSMGIGRRLVDQWCHRADHSGASVVRGPGDPFLEGAGFVRVGGYGVRMLVSR